MILGTGIDVTEVPRISDSIERFGSRFLERIYTDGEIRYCQSKRNFAERFAARFAAKEAATKAIGTGISKGVVFRNIEVMHQPGGRPTIVFSGRAREIADSLGVRHISLSLTHTAQLAIAQVILED
jgi:holo-[acyl-carrier protein] synthase